MKKVLTIALVVLLAALSVTASSAATVGDDSAVSAATTYERIKGLSIGKGKMLFYTYNLDSDTTASYYLENVTKNTQTVIKFKDFYNSQKTISISTTDTYKPLMGVRGYGGGGTFTYGNTAGKYDVIKIKLSDFSDYFNKDGSHTQYCEAVDGKFKYTFRHQVVNGVDDLYSGLFFESGGAVTCATPDSEGKVEIVVSKNPAHSVRFSTDYGYVIRSKGGASIGSGGGKNRGYLPGLRIGDVTSNDYVDVNDVSSIQSYLANMSSLNKLQRRSADLNRDGKITIEDVTILQRYLAEYDISQYYT